MFPEIVIRKKLRRFICELTGSTNLQSSYPYPPPLAERHAMWIDEATFAVVIFLIFKELLGACFARTG